MKLFKVFDKDGKVLGHISAMGEGEALEKAKKHNPQAVKVGPHVGGIPQAAPAKGPAADAEAGDEKKKPEEKKEEKK